jgi:uncharacterized protein (UPF0264 family)
MRLLVSVRNSQEATAAAAGGADIIDAKEPDAGALGPVDADAFREIVSVSARAQCPVTAALGDGTSEDLLELAAASFIRGGASLVKVGFAGLASRERVERLIAAAGRAAGPERVVAVAYADFGSVGALDPFHTLEAAARAGAAGFLIDTAGKDGPGTMRLLTTSSLTSLVAAAKSAGLLVAIAGRLDVADLPRVSDVGADIAGVRGAACDGGRRGRVTAARVRELRMRVHPTGGFTISPALPGARAI